jgi:porphobilinogen synthase
MAGMAPLSLRRTRLNRHVRELTRDIRLHEEQMIQPLFVVDGIRQAESISGMDMVFRDSPETILQQIDADLENGISKFLLFGIPRDKHETEFNHAFTSEQINRIKQRFGADLWLATDVCLCSYTTHGHCGVLNENGDHVLNDSTVEKLTSAACMYAEAGADCVAPSDMMDGRVGAIRATFDLSGLEQTLIMSYSAKFHSNFYGPFRHAADSAPSTQNKLTDRASYQLDPARLADALLSAQRDDAQGADILMVKPGLPYLDILARLSASIHKPWAIYQTSGEQAAIDVLAKQDLIDRDSAQRETWLAFVRAGASMIITYAARRARDILQQ